MDTKHKQRLVGVMVLISLAIIFLPSLFHRDQRVEVDTTTLIPSKPVAKPIVIKSPTKPADVTPAPAPEVAFQPPVVEEKAKQENIKTPAPEPETKPNLNEQGIPNAWVIQVGSFKSQTRADELKKNLLAKEYKAYTRSVNTAKGEFFRVFTGPYIDRSRALSFKKQIDKNYRVTSQVLKFAPQ